VAPKKQAEPNEIMVVNDSPGEECRIAILQDGHLEELFTERAATATNVGNIYKGKVVNVEPAIQAAFIDYGQGANGFLHISDLHPKHFPGEERTERVGKKIPRRDRPPIQAALRRGDEILVQVLKEGIGTKGPTLTSYLSIPGRLIVMMPDMDRVGVSRKVEDEAQRREMRDILDSLNLPEGFGFILRTAGFGKTKIELKRDSAYLLRLWKLMEKRIKGIGAPCELYTESDLLIRSVRDILRPSIKAIIVDSESAFDRVSMFLRVAAPRSAPTVMRYRRAAPIFHAFDVERQIELIHAREVPLPSGGRLVIDQTEALVAIDVNSGRSRSARDSETNAYETNIEATNEICRQLRLRDLGGLIVNDLIDMRSPKHRREIEELFESNLKNDRAKATALKISEFGIVEMTRQRMRPSIRMAHYMPCPHCNGHGEIRVPEYVASDAMRHVGYLLQYDRVSRVEMACSPRVASVLLSTKRRELVRMEDASGKRVDVRVSDAIAIDRVDYYAYDDRNADIEIAHLPMLTPPTIEQLLTEQDAPREIADLNDDEQADAGEGRRRRGRGRRSGPADAATIALSEDFADELDAMEDQDADDLQRKASQAAPAFNGHHRSEMPEANTPATGHGETGEGGRSRRRKRRRGGRGRNRGDAGKDTHANGMPMGDHQPSPQLADLPAADLDAWATTHPAESLASGEQGTDANIGPDGQPRRKRRRRRGRRGRGNPTHPSEHDQPISDQAFNAEAEPSAPSPALAEQPAPSTSAIRIHELAQELNVSSREVMDRCEADPSVHNVTSALSSISADEANTIRGMFSKESESTPGEQAPSGGRRKRRRRRRGGGNDSADEAAEPQSHAEPAMKVEEAGRDVDAAASTTPEIAESPVGGSRKKPRRRRRGRSGESESVELPQGMAIPANSSESRDVSPAQSSAELRPSTAGSNRSATTVIPLLEHVSAKKPRRSLYGAGRGSVSPSARDRVAQPDE